LHLNSNNNNIRADLNLNNNNSNNNNNAYHKKTNYEYTINAKYEIKTRADY
jgi:hypothetical protein